MNHYLAAAGRLMLSHQLLAWHATYCYNVCRVLHIGLTSSAQTERMPGLCCPDSKQWGCMQVAKKDWMESVQLVFDYFCERTPR